MNVFLELILELIHHTIFVLLRKSCILITVFYKILLYTTTELYLTSLNIVNSKNKNNNNNNNNNIIKTSE